MLCKDIGPDFFAIPTFSDSHSIASPSYISFSDGTKFLRQEMHVHPKSPKRSSLIKDYLFAFLNKMFKLFINN